ncbi:hypothetical protein [Sphingobacterium deserti]|uniref:hypothetical protein n=1 Tax=Sphingobacterium deserti TaxID=1229276 RepID=UPI0012FE916C|nr:hypothetical protein [Sphingobacterium deserti]
MTGQLSVAEMTVMIILGAIIIGPMQLSDLGFFHGRVALHFIAGLHVLFTHLEVAKIFS